MFIKDYKCINTYSAFLQAKACYLLDLMEVLCKEGQRKKGEELGPVNYFLS